MTDPWTRKLQTGWRKLTYRGQHRAADQFFRGLQSERRVLVGYLASGRPLYVPRPR